MLIPTGPGLQPNGSQPMQPAVAVSPLVRALLASLAPRAGVVNPVVAAQDNAPAPVNAGAVAAGTAAPVYPGGQPVTLAQPIESAVPPSGPAFRALPGGPADTLRGVPQPHLVPPRFPQPRGSGYATNSANAFTNVEGNRMRQTAPAALLLAALHATGGLSAHGGGGTAASPMAARRPALYAGRH